MLALALIQTLIAAWQWGQALDQQAWVREMVFLYGADVVAAARVHPLPGMFGLAWSMTALAAFFWGLAIRRAIRSAR